MGKSEDLERKARFAPFYGLVAIFFKTVQADLKNCIAILEAY
jgi:hypothetical protein